MLVFTFVSYCMTWEYNRRAEHSTCFVHNGVSRSSCTAAVQMGQGMLLGMPHLKAPQSTGRELGVEMPFSDVLGAG